MQILAFCATLLLVLSFFAFMFVRYCLNSIKVLNKNNDAMVNNINFLKERLDNMQVMAKLQKDV